MKYKSLTEEILQYLMIMKECLIMANNAKVLVLGVDAMDPLVTRRFMRESIMPNMEKLMKMSSCRFMRNAKRLWYACYFFAFSFKMCEILKVEPYSKLSVMLGSL